MDSKVLHSNCRISGLDRAKYNSLPKTTDCKPRIAKSIDAPSWPNGPMFFDTISYLGNSAVAAMVWLSVLIGKTQDNPADHQSRYKPPKPSPKDTNIENSKNTALFLVSCYQYILSGIVLSVGRPFRQPATSNGSWYAFYYFCCSCMLMTMKYTVPFVVTIIVTLLFCTYMLFEPSKWLASFMQLTEMSAPFSLWLVGLATVGFALAWTAERHFFQLLARYIGKFYLFLRPSRAKQRRRYKVLLEEMQR